MNKLVFIEKVDLSTIDIILSFSDCILIIENPNNMETIVKHNFKDSGLFVKKQKILYLGNSNLIFQTLYNHYREKYKEDPFDNLEFLQIVFQKNKVFSLKGDNIVLF